jgi:hypothetical protein
MTNPSDGGAAKVGEDGLGLKGALNPDRIT